MGGIVCTSEYLLGGTLQSDTLGIEPNIYADRLLPPAQQRKREDTKQLLLLVGYSLFE